MRSSTWRSLERARISRRRVLAGAGGLAALATLRATGLVCADGLESGAPVAGGRFQTAGTFFATLDPHVAISALPSRAYNTLLVPSVRDPDFVFFDLAGELEQPDDTTWLFSLRPDVRIAPNDLGVPERVLDAEDAFRSFQRIADTGAATAGPFVRQWFASHEAVDARTYVIRTPEAYAYFLARLGVFTAIPPREMPEQHSLRLGTRAVGGGPFTGRVFGQDVRFDRNPNYYRRDAAHGNRRLPYVDGWDQRVVADRPVRRDAFLDGRLHRYDTQEMVEAAEILSFRDDVYAVEQPVNTFISLTLNVKRPPWNDARIRLAALYALNRQEYIDRVYNGGARANGLVHWPLGPFALPDGELDMLQPFNPDLSRQLIFEATGQESIAIDVLLPVTTIEQHDQHLPIFLTQMAAAGFDVQQEPTDFTLWLQRYTDVDYAASLALNQIYDTPEIPLDFQHSLGPQRDGSFAGGVQDPDVDDAIDAARRTVDRAALVDAVLDAQRLIYERGPAYIPIVSPLTATLYHDFVQNPPKGLGGAVEAYLSDFWLGDGAHGGRGDVNGDLRADAIDAALVLQRAAGLVPSLPFEGNADVNDDGRIDSIDAALILQRGAGLIAGLPR